MWNRRQFLARTLQGSSLLALGSAVPGFLANTARAVEHGKDTVLVVLEMTGGNDGLNTVIPHEDDIYQKARPTLAFKKKDVVKVTDEIGLHPAFRSLQGMVDNKQVAVVQGVGYPNPDRSHFESMDIWQLADPKRARQDGWIARGVPGLQDDKGNVPVMQIGSERLPLALKGAPSGVVSVNNQQPYKLDFGTSDVKQQKARRALLQDLAEADEPKSPDLLQFVQRRQLQTYSTLDKMQEVLKSAGAQQNGWFPGNTLGQRLNLIARMIEKGLGTRVFYAAIEGFDTHSGQAEMHRKLLADISDGLNFFFNDLTRTGHAKRVLVMTFSEFGRRVHENGSRGTDHGSGSCLFVVGPAAQGGLVTKHPDLKNLDSGDVRWHTDFRRVYATLLDGWLGCESHHVLGDKFEHLPLLKA